MSIRRSIVSLVTLVALSACRRGPTTPASVLLEVTAAVSPASIVVGDTAHITITVKNISDQTLQVTSGGCNTEFRFVNLTGKTFYPAETIACTLIANLPLTLAPGESRALSAFTTGRAIDPLANFSMQLAPGSYFVQGQVTVWRNDEEPSPVRNIPAALTVR